MPFPHASRAALLVLMCLLLAPAFAAVHLPSGEFRETVEDLRVKVRNGHVVIARTWQADDLNKGVYRWHPNPAWDDLRFDMDIIDGVPKTIHRAGSRFERSGNEVYVFDRQYFIRAVTDENDITTGWRWSDRIGNFITYAADGKIASYGNRNGTTVQFLRDAQQRVGELRDGANALILAYTLDGAHVVAITDRAGRSVSYHYTGDQLTAVTNLGRHDPSPRPGRPGARLPNARGAARGWHYSTVCRSSQPMTVSCQWMLFCGFSTQWFSSGK